MRGKTWGPFSGGQLTAIIITLAVVIGLPVAASAASAVFTSNSASRAAVAGTNSDKRGVGVQGNGKRFGVFSNGPLGVKTGKSFVCGACVTPADLSTTAKNIQVLPSGQSESGMFAAGAGDSAAGPMGLSITYPRPLASAIADANVIDTGLSPDAHCPHPGAASPGYLCLYDEIHDGVTFSGAYSDNTKGASFSRPSVGADVFWSVHTINNSYVVGEYTVTAP